MTYKKFMSLFLIAGSIASTLCSCAATDSSAVVGYIDEHPITMEEFNYFLSQQKSSVCQSYSQLYGITSFDSAFWNNEYGDSTPLAKKPVWKHTPHKCLPRRQLLLSSCRFPN